MARRRREYAQPIEVEAEGVWLDEAARVDEPSTPGRIKLGDLRVGLETAGHNLSVAERQLADLPEGDSGRRRALAKVERARRWVTFLESEIARKSRLRAPL